METHALGNSGKWGLKIKPNEAGEGLGHIYYNEDTHQLYTTQRIEMGRKGRRVPLTDLLPTGRPPQRNGHFKCLSESSGSRALAPCSGRGKGGRDLGKWLMKESKSLPPEDSLIRPWGVGTGHQPSAHSHCPVQVTEGSRLHVPTCPG